MMSHSSLPRRRGHCCRTVDVFIASVDLLFVLFCLSFFSCVSLRHMWQSVSSYSPPWYPAVFSFTVTWRKLYWRSSFNSFMWCVASSQSLSLFFWCLTSLLYELCCLCEDLHILVLSSCLNWNRSLMLLRSVRGEFYVLMSPVPLWDRDAVKLLALILT